MRQTELKDLFLHELKDIFNAETQLVKALWEETTRQSVGNGTMRPGPLITPCSRISTVPYWIATMSMCWPGDSRCGTRALRFRTLSFIAASVCGAHCS